MACRHSALQRGLLAAKSPTTQGRFGQLFPDLHAAHFGRSDDETRNNLAALATQMTSPFDAPKDGPDGEESGMPALYTYFGQFIDHDITFDPISVLTKRQDPDGLTNFRTPALDLDNIYGRGPHDQPYMYDDKGLKFQLGEELTGLNVTGAHDLPRSAGRGLIGDPRNDENSIVSQLQGLFHRFHNQIVRDNANFSFEQVQQRVQFHYQYVVLNDFLPRLVTASVLDELKTNGQFDKRKFKFFSWKKTPFIPIEFSVAAYRLGHSMIRSGYRLNDSDVTLLPIFPVPTKFPDGLTGFKTMRQGWAIDWARFIDIEKRPYGTSEEDGASAEPDPNNKRRLQLAYRIDTSLVDPLSMLPDSVASDDPKSLPQRNLERGWRLGLPSGQTVAKAMHVPVLDDSKILIGKALDEAGADEKPVPIAEIADGVFANNCPLWTYILAEAMHHQTAMPIAATGGPATVNTPQLGPVGGRIVAEVLVGLIFGDQSSLLSKDPSWTPASGADFKLKDIVAYALGKGPKLH
ncbi:hypothetical protein FH972_021090 [Carpinus fangiana]|uniref:Heme peroxidase n=1 Tax=Carpinus fangiana TaxID=176857 RepID=A0A5N6KND9_9ROSI|nr:hypothetical protein FH972_021090 [Carpinus fangiana]